MESTITCAHNYEGQKRVPGRAVPCRGCGALLTAQPNANDEVAPASTEAVYPGYAKPEVVTPDWED